MAAAVCDHRRSSQGRCTEAPLGNVNSLPPLPALFQLALRDGLVGSGAVFCVRSFPTLASHHMVAHVAWHVTSNLQNCPFPTQTNVQLCDVCSSYITGREVHRCDNSTGQSRAGEDLRTMAAE